MYLDKDIESVLISEEEITTRIKELGKEISDFYKNKEVLVVGVLSGVIPFLGQLIKYLDFPARIDYVKCTSYEGENSTGNIRFSKDMSFDPMGQDILLCEDILDTGLTVFEVKKLLYARGAKSVKVTALIDKPSRREYEVKGDWIGFEIPNKFIVGFGLDYNQYYRNLPYIGVLKPEAIKK